MSIDASAPIPLGARPDGFLEVTVPGVRDGARYAYVFPDGRRRPDPASRLQEGSVHGPSTVVDLSFPWTDGAWRGLDRRALVFYELHVGTFTQAGTLDAAIEELPRLKDLGITALALMPVAAFDGPRGWGYDGVLLYAVHAPYGGPRALQRLVDAAHGLGLAVFLDVVYNHLGPSGNYLAELGPYFTDAHHTPWGEAINCDGPGADFVRSFVIENALSWIRDFHVDGLRLDAVNRIVDASKTHLLAELAERVKALADSLRRRVHLVAESDANDPRIVLPRESGGLGLDAQWSDDFHHALHAVLTGERDGFYQDFGRLADLAEAFREPFVLKGQHSAFRGGPHGRSSAGIPGTRFVVASQNHDQIGNRALGERLSALLPTEAVRLAATATLLSPYLPLLFMGEEYAEQAPFLYFTSFPEASLGRAVTDGRRRDLALLGFEGEVPDPQDPGTFQRSRIRAFLRCTEPHAAMQRFYRTLLEVRAAEPSLASERSEDREVSVDSVSRTLLVRRRANGRESLLVLHVAAESGEVLLPAGRFRVAVDAWAKDFSGTAKHALSESPHEGRLRLGPFHAALLLRDPGERVRQTDGSRTDPFEPGRTISG